MAPSDSSRTEPPTASPADTDRVRVGDGDADSDTDAGPDSDADVDAEAPRRKIGLSEAGVADDGTALVTSGLGSCLGVALYDPEAGVGGLLHAMLPRADGRPGAAEKFVVEGIAALVAALADAGADPDRLRAKLAGAAEMLDLSVGETEGTIGERNVAAAEGTLARLSVPVVAADTGGGRGRSLRLDTATGDLRVSYAGAGTVVL